MENAHFWKTFEQCNLRMPINTARAFMMREFMDMSTEEICQELSISTTNCWVLLHRARWHYANVLIKTGLEKRGSHAELQTKFRAVIAIAGPSYHFPRKNCDALASNEVHGLPKF